MVNYDIIEKGFIRKYCVVKVVFNGKTKKYYTMKGLVRLKSIIGTDVVLRIVQKIRIKENKMLFKAYSF